MRLYNGCPDEELQNLLDRKKEAKEKIKQLGTKLGLDINCVYFPNGEFWQLFEGYKPIGKEHKTIFMAVEEANKLFKGGFYEDYK